MNGTGSTLRAGSQAARIVAVLRDGRPHTATAIHQAVGTCRLNSRISELRSRGLDITCTRIHGVPAGPDAYEYELHAAATPDGPLGESGPPPCFPSRGPDSPNEPAVLTLFDEQAA